MKTTKITCDVCKSAANEVHHFEGTDFQKMRVAGIDDGVTARLMESGKPNPVDEVDLCPKCIERIEQRSVGRLIEEDRAYA